MEILVLGKFVNFHFFLAESMSRYIYESCQSGDIKFSAAWEATHGFYFILFDFFLSSIYLRILQYMFLYLFFFEKVQECKMKSKIKNKVEIYTTKILNYSYKKIGTHRPIVPASGSEAQSGSKLPTSSLSKESLQGHGHYTTILLNAQDSVGAISEWLTSLGKSLGICACLARCLLCIRAERHPCHHAKTPLAPKNVPRGTLATISRGRHQSAWACEVPRWVTSREVRPKTIIQKKKKTLSPKVLIPSYQKKRNARILFPPLMGELPPDPIRTPELSIGTKVLGHVKYWDGKLFSCRNTSWRTTQRYTHPTTVYPICVKTLSPARRGDDIVNPKTRDIRLYVKCVFISDVFVKGIVDSNDLPLNVLKRLVQKAFDMILFWENFGKHLKLGCMEDHLHHKCIAPLLKFFSCHSEQELINLDEYVENMNPKQKDIYYIAADNLTKYEVLFLVDPIDKVAITKLKSYKEKNFVDITKEDLDLEQARDKVTSTIGDTSSLDFMHSRRVFKINLDHPIIKDLNVAYLTSFDNPKTQTVIVLLYDMALISSGFTPDNPTKLSGKIYEMIAMMLSIKWVAPLVEIVEPLVQIEGLTN
ncbi:unnamed protein product [Spirodela intermedia]|uniref:Uncharacterized protein n=1 Tax=Spirodela intermedia TaxID=51605 RepID=A0A7I8JMC5_SPIIN|nr:unnamed protein product [Spirodela intermedia]CAA6671250.1 unnamed protein product [Spirodela intermedia]